MIAPRPSQLDDELQRLISDMAFVRVLNGQGRCDQYTAPSSSTPSATTGTSPSSPDSPHGGLRLGIPNRRREALSNRNPRRYYWSATASSPPRHEEETTLEERRRR